MANRFNFSEYTMDELDYTRKMLVNLMDMWTRAEIALCDAHIHHDTEETLTDWKDVYDALTEVEKAIENR